MDVRVRDHDRDRVNSRASAHVHENDRVHSQVSGHVDQNGHDHNLECARVPAFVFESVRVDGCESSWESACGRIDTEEQRLAVLFRMKDV